VYQYKKAEGRKSYLINFLAFSNWMVIIMFHKILAAVDNSPISEKVFNEAVSLAKTTNANLMLIHVLSVFDESYLSSAGAYSNIYYPTLNANNIEYHMRVWEGLKEAGLKYLQMLRHEANELGVPTEIIQNLGDPGRIICDAASDCNVDLIIMGHRGLSGLNEFFLGSVSNYVLHHAPCSVLTVQGKTLTKSEEVEKTQILEKSGELML
jgi:nucleotide-binding universal stress UspA family protein